MTLAEKSRTRAMQLAVVVMLSIVPPAGAVTLRRQCREACGDLIAACVASGQRPRPCRRQVLRQCREQGVAFCQTADDSGAGSRAAGGALTSLLPPSALSAAASSSSAIALRWTDTNSRESGYLVDRTLNPAAGFTTIATLPNNSTSFNDSGLAASTTYFYRVRAYGRKGSFSGYSAVVSATTLPPSLIDNTPPTVPTGLGATPVSCSQINVAWAASTDTGSGVKGYNVYRNGGLLKQVLAPATSTSDTGLTGSTSYSYTVSAVDNAGNESAPTTAASAFTPACGDTTPPTTPTNLSANAGTCGSVNLSWLASIDSGSGLKGYRIYRNGGLVTLVMAPSTAYTDIALAASTSYTYTVSAVDNAGNESSVSASAGATTPSCATTTTTTIPTTTTTTTTPPTTTTSTTTTSSTTTTRPTTTTTTLASTTTTSAPTTSTTTTTRPTTTTTTATTTTVPTTTTTIPTTTTTTVTTSTTTTTIPPDTTAPVVPGGLNAQPVTCSQMNVGWNSTTDTGGSGLKAYNLYRGGAFLKQVMAPTTSTSDAGLAASTIYSYAVSAVDNAGNESSRSATMSANTPACPDTTPPSVPTGVTATVASCSQINLAWTASTDSGGSGLAGYRIYRGGAFLKQVLAPATSTSDSGLPASTTYSYTVYAYDSTGNQSGASAAASATTSACSTVAPTLKGFVPGVGTAKDVVVAGNLAYVASAEFGVAVVDVTVPSAPRATKGATLPFYGDRLAISGSVAVATTRNVGLRVLDLSNPVGPAPVGFLAGSMSGVAMSGRYAYPLIVVPGNPGHVDVLVVDVGVPSAPTIVGRVTVAGGSELDVDGTYVYVAAGGVGVQVVDVSVPTAPRVVATVDTPGSATSVTVAGGYAYVADGNDVAVVDVQNPTQPVLRGTLATAASAIGVAGTRAYVVDGLNFKIVDVANPAAPALLYTGTGYGAQRITASGTVAYLASANVNPSQNQGGLYVIDAATPTAPRLLTNVYGGFDNWAVAASGSLGVATGNLAGLKIVDMSNLSAPRVLATMAGTFTGAGINGQYAYVLQTVAGNPGHIDLVVLNLQTPAVPVVAGRLTVAGGSQLAVDGSFVYVAAGGTGLQVVDVSSPTAPRLVGTADTPGSAMAVSVENGWAYIADQTSIVTVDVTTPSRPVLRGSVPATATAIAVTGNRVYAVDGMQLKIVDVTSPATPALLSTTTAYGAQSVSGDGSFVFLAVAAVNHLDTAGGLYVLDATDPLRPALVKQVLVPGTIRSVQTEGGVICTGDSSAVIDVITMTP